MSRQKELIINPRRMRSEGYSSLSVYSPLDRLNVVLRSCTCSISHAKGIVLFSRVCSTVLLLLWLIVAMVALSNSIATGCKLCSIYPFVFTSIVVVAVAGPA